MEYSIKKGNEVISKNHKAIDYAMAVLNELDTSSFIEKETEQESLSTIDMIRKRKGNELPTSAFVPYQDGTFHPGVEEPSVGMAETVPSWIMNNCIMCNQCSIVCPHGVIRPYLLTLEEYQKAPELIQRRCKKA